MMCFLIKRYKSKKPPHPKRKQGLLVAVLFACAGALYDANIKKTKCEKNKPYYLSYASKQYICLRWV